MQIYTWLVIFGVFCTASMDVSYSKLAVSPKMAHVEAAKNCRDYDININLVYIIKLEGHLRVCPKLNGHWEVSGGPCIKVVGFKPACHELKFSSESSSHCSNWNVIVANATLCGVVENKCIKFNGRGCYRGSCEKFDVTAKCF